MRVVRLSDDDLFDQIEHFEKSMDDHRKAMAKEAIARGKAINQLRKRGWSLKEIADKKGITVAAVSASSRKGREK